MTEVRDDYAAIADVYDLWCADVTDDLPFWVSEAVGASGAVLEVGVGTGRVAVALARAGVHVVGIDVSPSMLARARARVEAEGLGDRVELHLADMRSLAMGRRFPLAIAPYRVLAHALTVEDQVATLGALREHLEPGGRLLFNLAVPSAADLRDTEGLHREGQYRLDDGREVVLWRASSYAPGTQLLTFHFVLDELEPGGLVGRRFHGRTVLRQVSPGEIEHALARSGLAVVERWGWFDRRPYDEHAAEMVWSAVRRDRWRREEG